MENLALKKKEYIYLSLACSNSYGLVITNYL